MDAMLLILLSWLMMRPDSPLQFAKTKLIDSDFDIVVLKSARDCILFHTA